MNSRLPALLLLVFSFFLSPAGAADKPVTKRMRWGYYYVTPRWTNDAFSDAEWWIPNRNGRYDASPKTGAGVITHYRLQDPDWTKNGVIVISPFHSIPDTKNEQKAINDFQLKLYRLKEWREAEDKLVNELVVEANKQGVPVWINTTRYVGNQMATFQLLTDPKLTLKK